MSFCSLYWVPVLFQAIVGRKRARTWTRVALSANGGLVTGQLRFGSGAFCGNQGFIIIKKDEELEARRKMNNISTILNVRKTKKMVMIEMSGFRSKCKNWGANVRII